MRYDFASPLMYAMQHIHFSSDIRSILEIGKVYLVNLCMYAKRNVVNLNNTWGVKTKESSFLWMMARITSWLNA